MSTQPHPAQAIPAAFVIGATAVVCLGITLQLLLSGEASRDVPQLADESTADRLIYSTPLTPSSPSNPARRNRANALSSPVETGELGPGVGLRQDPRRESEERHVHELAYASYLAGRIRVADADEAWSGHVRGELTSVLAEPRCSGIGLHDIRCSRDLCEIALSAEHGMALAEFRQRSLVGTESIFSGAGTVVPDTALERQGPRSFRMFISREGSPLPRPPGGPSMLGP
jgi:hypothetical protein